MNLGDNRCGGDGEAERVSVDELGLAAGMVEAHGVDEEVVGLKGKALDGGEHGHSRGLVDVDAVDGLGVDGGDGEGERHAADLLVEGFALFAGELFGVFEAGGGKHIEALGQDDSGGDDRAEQRAAAHFIDTGDALEAVVAKGLLRCVAADEQLEHALFRGSGGDLFLEDAFFRSLGHARQRRV